MIKATDLKLSRSDLGDGGWSLHYGPDEILVGSGESRKSRAGWSRPNKSDYAAARKEAEKIAK